MKNEKVLAPLSISIVIIILLQIALGVGNNIFSVMIPDSRFAEQMLSMCLMIVFTAPANYVVLKLAAGLGYGVVLSLLRLKTKNCYATVLAHGVLNLFMI